MSPDTQQNLMYTIFFIFLHNWEAIFYSCGIAFVTLWDIYRPSRGKIIIMWGFVALLFTFEYKKHILDGLREQTRNSLITERQSYRVAYAIDKVTMRFIPRGLPILGWMMIIAGITLEVKGRRKTTSQKTA